LKIKVLWHAECAAFTTGFGVVSKNILTGLHEDENFEVRQIALAHRGDPETAQRVPFMMYPVIGSEHGEDVVP